MLKISYIVPFYNGKDSILNSLNSIYDIGLPEEEFEVIVVDDRSPISAGSAIENFVSQHSNIRVVRHNVNKRQGGAKNTGIRLAKGQYIAFADQDDTILADNANQALVFALKNDVDMLACQYDILKEDGLVRHDGISKGDGLIVTGKEFCENYFMTGYNLAPWANLYKREFLLRINHPYEENVVMEDSDWIAWHWIHAERVGIFNKPIYTWIMNPSSITHSMHYINRADWVKYGYRKVRDAEIYRPLSSIFADTMTMDGKNNIIGGMKKMWKVDNYYKFYHHLDPILPDLQKIKWKGITSVLISNPTISLIFMYPIGSLLKLMSYARYKFKS